MDPKVKKWIVKADKSYETTCGEYEMLISVSEGKVKIRVVRRSMTEFKRWGAVIDLDDLPEVPESQPYPQLVLPGAPVEKEKG